ncbi:IS5 family transposase [Acetobacter sp. AN02]|nr:IS5 family transposase [Acetobacter sp. AN02]MDG6094521.1 IS5 family transposase [Acetobacter sp. AN02]
MTYGNYQKTTFESLFGKWERIAPLMPSLGRRGRPREVEFREVINAVRYLVRSGCGWHLLPIHFGHWRTVYGWFRELVRRFLFQTIHDVELMLDREQAGREVSPTAAVIDSRASRLLMQRQGGYDVGKKVVGRKRHIAVDTDERLLMVNLTPADISDNAGTQMILDAIRKRWPWVKHLFADGACRRNRQIAVRRQRRPGCLQIARQCHENRVSARRDRRAVILRLAAADAQMLSGNRRCLLHRRRAKRQAISRKKAQIRCCHINFYWLRSLRAYGFQAVRVVAVFHWAKARRR